MTDIKHSRNSTMELLRIIAMVLVMTNHAGFMALGVPSPEDAAGSPLLTALTFSDMALSITCVNIFVLLSGWFGIKWRPIKIWGLIFQVVFFSLAIYAALCVINPQGYANFGSLATALLLHNCDYWFVKSYLLLFLLAPMLNKFIEEATKKQLGIFLLCFYAIQTIYGWLSINGASDFAGGYSMLSFIGLYTLAAYLRLHGSMFNSWRAIHFIAVYLGIAAVQAVVAIAVTRLGLPIAGRLFTYTNPLVIIQSASIVMAFAKMKGSNIDIINWVAASCFAVYLFHGNEFLLRPYYAKYINGIFQTNGITTAILLTAAFIAVVFVASILIDKVRLLLWNGICRIKNKQ